VSIKDRLHRLETENAKRCRECRDTPPAIRVLYPGELEPDPEHCPGCGRSLGVLIRVEYEGQGGGGEPY
jgi:hypothetical protein